MRLISPSLLLTLPITLTVTSVLASSSSKTPTGTTTADTNPNAKSGNAVPNANANAAPNGADGAPGNASGGRMEVPQLGTIVQRANTLLTTGQFNDAARTYTEALELSPNDYVLYFKRATAYLSSNRHSPALDDFDKVLQLTDGTFDGAVIAKAKIYTKEGRWEESREALTAYSKRVPGDKAAQELMFSVADGEQATKKANKAQKSGKWDECIEQTTHALQIAAYSSSLRQQRADCALSAGDVEQAIADLTRLTHLGISSTPLLLRISTLAYFMSPPSAQGMQTLKQCLHFDPDSKPCKAAHRIIKALDKQFAELEKAGDDSRKVLKIVTTEGTGLAAKFDQAMTDAMAAMDPPLPSNIVPSRISQRRAAIWRAACKSYIQLNDVRKGEKWCAELLRMDKDDLDGLVGSGEAALKNEEWDEAIRLFDHAFEASGKSSHDIHQRLQKAQRLRKQAKKKDYYKVLGVSRDTDPKTIKKAYRKAAMNAHPDKGGSESKMAAVNEAYEVLSNPELRQRYDNGDDPNDPESQQGGHPFHGSPFQFFQQAGGPFSGGQQFHGGGQQFHFQWGH